MRTPDLQARSVVDILAAIFGLLTVLVVTICSARFHIKNSSFCPNRVCVCVWISEQTVIIRLYSTGRCRCVFLYLRTDSDYSPVQHWSLYVCMFVSQNRQWLFACKALNVVCVYVCISEHTVIIRLYSTGCCI